MSSNSPTAQTPTSTRTGLFTILVFLALAAFCALFVWAGDAYLRFLSPRFPNVGASAWLATAWGVLSRLHVLIPALLLALWQPRRFGFQIGETRRHWRALLIMLLANCGVIAAYLWLTGSGTPYSGNQWLVTEVITVPLVEETVWRGIVFAVLLLALSKFRSERASAHLAVWGSGVAFGLLHASNILAGVPVLFVAVQTLNAVIWGVVYGYARAMTKSIYPPILLHAAMNLVVVLF